ncbi:MAG: NAD-dependent epimerase/dehydratase family protein, partial [Anaerolineae bacterium]
MSILNHELKNRNVLVTGATGFIGGRLAQRLAVEEGAVVTGLGRQLDKVPFLTEAGVRLERADMRDTAVLRQLLAGQEILFHAAALRMQVRPSGAEAEAVNVTAVGELVRLAAAAGVRRVVHISSINAYGPPQRDLIDESHPINPGQRDFYGRTKAQAEQAATAAAAETGIELVIVRPGMVYGPRSESWSARMVETLRQGIPVIFGKGDGYA